MSLAERLKGLVALAEGLSLRELATLAQVSPSYPSLIVSGARSKIGADVAGGLAKVLGSTLDYLLLGTGEPPTRAEIATALQAARTAEAARQAEASNPTGTDS